MQRREAVDDGAGADTLFIFRPEGEYGSECKAKAAFFLISDHQSVVTVHLMMNLYVVIFQILIDYLTDEAVGRQTNHGETVQLMRMDHVFAGQGMILGK